MAETGTQADDDGGADWASWDQGVADRLLRSDNEGVVRRTLRRMHIRLWHAPVAKLKALLEAGGVPSKVVEMIQSVVDTCRICRLWQRPSPQSVHTSRLSTHFIQRVQYDFVFHGKMVILHLIDGAIKWTVLVETGSRETQNVIEAIMVHWVSQFGPPEILEGD